LTALGLVAEISDFSRFKSAEEFMAFVGLVPSEHSSGEKSRRTATGLQPTGRSSS
jgi:transposase